MGAAAAVLDWRNRGDELLRYPGGLQRRSI